MKRRKKARAKRVKLSAHTHTSCDPVDHELAAVAAVLMESGNTDPSADEITHAYYKVKAVPAALTQDTRRRLRKLRAILEQDFGKPVCLVGRTYYTSGYRETPPEDSPTARRCLPWGNGKAAEGLYLNVKRDGTDDLIYQASIELHGKTGAGKARVNVDRMLDGVQERRIGIESAAGVIDEIRTAAITTRPAMEARVLKKLPPPDGPTST